MDDGRFTVFEGTSKPSVEFMERIGNAGGKDDDAYLTSGVDNQVYGGYGIARGKSLLGGAAIAAGAPLNSKSMDLLDNMPDTLGSALRVAAIHSYIDEGIDVTHEKINVLIEHLVNRDDSQVLSFFHAPKAGGSIILQATDVLDSVKGGKELIEISHEHLANVLSNRTTPYPDQETGQRKTPQYTPGARNNLSRTGPLN